MGHCIETVPKFAKKRKGNSSVPGVYHSIAFLTTYILDNRLAMSEDKQDEHKVLT